MKKRLPQLMANFKQLGFTMIELLIVISILGILSVAVLSAINPIEQINRGRDTGSRSDAEQLLSAVDRFYAFQGYYPWQTGASDTDHAALALTELSSVTAVKDNASPQCSFLAKLSNGSDLDTNCTSGANELKATFVDRITGSGYNYLWIYNQGGTGDSTYLCFKAKSKAFEVEADSRCVDADGSGLPTDIDATTKATLCAGYGSTSVKTYVCLP